MGLLKSLLGETRSIEDPLRPLTASSLIDVLGGPSTYTGIAVNEQSAMRVIAVYRAVSLVAGAIGSLPIRAFRMGDNRVPFRSDLLENPHPDLTPMELWQMVMTHLLLWGNAYCHIERDGTDTITALDPIAPARVTVEGTERTRDNPAGKVYTVRLDNGTDRRFTPRDFLHVRGPGYDGLYGLSPIGVARQGIAMSVAAEEYGARLFGSGTLMGGVLQTDQKLNQEQADAVKSRWQKFKSGLAHAHEIGVLDSGTKFVPIGIPPEDAQFIESRKFQVTEIARLYGIPPHLLGDIERSTSWGTGIEQQGIGFVTYTLGPWISNLEQRISRVCLPANVMAEFNTDRLMRGDAKARAASARTWIEIGVKNSDTVRREEGLPPREDGKGGEYMKPANWESAAEADEEEPVMAPFSVVPDEVAV